MTETPDGTEGTEGTEGRFAQLVGHEVKPISPIPREALPFQGHRAGLVTRFVADAVDFAIAMVILGAIYASYATLLFLVNPRSFSFPTFSFGVVLLAGGFVLILYLTIGWWLTGRTYGKHLMGLRVVNIGGNRLHLLGAFLRSSFCVFFPIGLFWVLVSPANRSIQDVVLRTSVIHDWAVRRSQAAALVED